MRPACQSPPCKCEMCFLKCLSKHIKCFRLTSCFESSQVYSAHYSMNINGEVREGSVEIDSADNVERFKTGSGDEEVVEIRDFQSGITAIRFFGGDKCYIKSQIKVLPPFPREFFCFSWQTDEEMPVRFDEELLIWVSSEQPLKDIAFLSTKILALCGELPIYWLQPLSPKVYEFHVNLVGRFLLFVQILLFPSEYINVISQTKQSNTKHESCLKRDTGTVAGAGEGGAMTFDSMLDHQGICCAECQRGYTHCQRICEPLRGHWPWPYNYRGCRVACRIIMPCRWWMARILGIV
uniref:Leukocyte cell-derived chemotaxin 1 n=1 Tax=Hippocampus comes TaxID=109280 RepID=A0A3Q3DRT8_HIPCM